MQCFYGEGFSGLECLLWNTSIARTLRYPISSTSCKTMTMLTGIKAFEARWQSIKRSDRVSSIDGHRLVQAMGRLIDNYATPDEIRQELPVALRAAFDRLVDAYLSGYWLNDSDQAAASDIQQAHCTEISPAMLAATQRHQRRKMQPTEASEAATYVVRDPAELSMRAFRSASA